MRININISEDLLNQIDEKAKALFISRSAYIATALSQKLQNDKLMDSMPEMLQTMKSAVELEITMETFGHEHKQAIIRALRKHGYNPKLIQPKAIYQ